MAEKVGLTAANWPLLKAESASIGDGTAGRQASAMRFLTCISARLLEAIILHGGRLRISTFRAFPGLDSRHLRMFSPGFPGVDVRTFVLRASAFRWCSPSFRHSAVCSTAVRGEGRCPCAALLFVYPWTLWL